MRIAAGSTVLGLLIAVQGLFAQQSGERIATCRATLDGQQLTTVIEFSNGYHVVGPWRVMATRDRRLNGDSGIAIDARLDRVIERNPGTDRDVTTPFPHPVQTSFEGATEQDLVTKAAEIWCTTVLRVQETQTSPSPGNGRPRPAAPTPPDGKRDPGPRVVLGY
ncbi:MAG TPA: hypothetical protein VNZ57_10515 [Longimicrobiales bacterium]|nr:hypothetical protein [Longimicrobiales bacterium]